MSSRCQSNWGKGMMEKKFPKTVISLGPTNTGNVIEAMVLVRYRYNIQMPYLTIIYNLFAYFNAHMVHESAYWDKW